MCYRKTGLRIAHAGAQAGQMGRLFFPFQRDADACIMVTLETSRSASPESKQASIWEQCHWFGSRGSELIQ